MTLTQKTKSATSILAITAAALATMAMPITASAQIDEIVTTAQRTDQSLQDAPVAVTVISEELIENVQITDSLDVQRLVPTLNIGTNTGTANAARIFLRGVGEDESRGAVEPAVGTYVDGVYYGRIVGALFDLVDLEQVEVLRGPQGTLYGRNSNGGAIKITTIKPQDETTFSGRFTYGTNELIQGKGVANIAIGDTTAVRVAGLYKERDGFFTVNPNGAATGETRDNVGSLDTLMLRGQFSQDIGNWNLLIAGDYTDDNSDPIPSSVVDSIDADGDIFTVEPGPGDVCGGSSTNPVGPFFDTRTVGCFNAHSNQTEALGVSGTLTGELGGHTVQAIVGYRELQDDLQSHIGFPFAQQTDQEQISGEITLSSDAGGPFNYVVGAYYWDEALVLDSTFVFPFRVAADTESIAVFGQGSFDVTEDLNLTAGARYTDESRAFDGINMGVPAFGIPPMTNAANNDFDNISYTGKISYDVGDDVMLYASYSTGFKGSGFSPDCFGPLACFLPVREEEVATIEGGFRTQLWDNRMQFNGTYFHNTYDDLQIGATVPGLGFTRFNVDETQIQGFEFDLNFSPTKNFTLLANLGILDGEYQSFGTEPAEIERQIGGLTNQGAACPGGVATVECAAGLELKNAPNWKGNLAVIYNHQLGSGDLKLSGDISWEDDSFSLVANGPESAFTSIPTLVNGRISYEPEDSFWNVALWAKNIFDEEYFRAGTATGIAVFAAEPATYGVDIGFDF